MIKFLHLMLGTTFLGLMIAELFYITRSLKKGDMELMTYSLKVSYFADACLFFMGISQFFTAIKLVSAGHFSLAVPWIFIAYLAFGVVVLLWFGIFLIKLLYFSRSNIPSAAIKVFYGLNLMLILIFIIIIHDAVTQSSWFDFLLWKD